LFVVRATVAWLAVVLGAGRAVDGADLYGFGGQRVGTANFPHYRSVGAVVVS
jgi:hypothetical protein